MKIMVLDKNDKFNYTLIVRLTDEGNMVKCCPFVVCWYFDESSQTWAQGHYFMELRNAVDYLYTKGEIDI